MGCKMLDREFLDDLELIRWNAQYAFGTLGINRGTKRAYYEPLKYAEDKCEMCLLGGAYYSFTGEKPVSSSEYDYASTMFKRLTGAEWVIEFPDGEGKTLLMDGVRVSVGNHTYASRFIADLNDCFGRDKDIDVLFEIMTVFFRSRKSHSV